MSNLSRDQLRAVAKAATDALRAELGLHDPDDDGPKSYFGEYVTGAQVRAVVEALESAGYLLTRLDAIGPAVVPKGRPIVASPRNGAYRDYSDNEKGLFPRYTPEEVAQMGDPAPFPAPEPPAPKVAEPPAAPLWDAYATISEAEARKHDVTKVADNDDDNDNDESPFADFAPDEIEDGGEDVETTPLREPYQVPTPVDTWTQKQHALYLRLAPLLQRLARDGYMPTMAQYDAQRGDLPTAMGVTLKLGLKWSELAAKLGLAIRPRGHRFGKGKGMGMATDAAPEPEPEPEPEKPAVPRLRGTALLNANGLVESVSQTTVPSAPTPILHRAPDGGVTRILRNSDGRHVRSLQTFEGGS